MVANTILQAHLSICPFLVTLPLPEAFCSCLSVTLKAPCCPEHLKIYVVCFKLKWTSVYQHWRESRLYCLLWERRVCLPHSIHLGDFQQDSLIIWGFLLNSIMLWANPLSQIDLRGRPRTEMSRRMKCPRFILEVRETPVFLSYLVLRHWETEMIPSLPDQPHHLCMLWVLMACHLLNSPLKCS